MRTGVRPKSPQVTRHVRYARKGQRGGWANHSLEQECCQTSYQLIERLATEGARAMCGRELRIDGNLQLRPLTGLEEKPDMKFLSNCLIS